MSSSSAKPLPKALEKIDELLAQYEVFLLDTWGVLHDGYELYPGAKATLSLLKQANKPCLIVSNSLRRQTSFKSQLQQLGVAADLYTDVVTSGELCWQAFAQGDDLTIKALGIAGARRCYYLGTDSGQRFTEGLDLEVVSDIKEAQFVLNMLSGGGYDVSTFDRLLEKANELGLPMVCPNPDLNAIKHGQPIICAGAVAKAFEALGGRVGYFGKPHSAVYAHCFSRFAKTQRASFLMLGDGLLTDIKGANQVGIDSVLLLSGIHQAELSANSQETVFERYGAQATYLLPSLRRE